MTKRLPTTKTSSTAATTIQRNFHIHTTMFYSKHDRHSNWNGLSAIHFNKYIYRMRNLFDVLWFQLTAHVFGRILLKTWYISLKQRRKWIRNGILLKWYFWGEILNEWFISLWFIFCIHAGDIDNIICFLYFLIPTKPKSNIRIPREYESISFRLLHHFVE